MATRHAGDRRSTSSSAAGRRRVAGVETDQGRIECEVVVNAGGMYSHEIGRLAGVDVPVVPMAHQYAITRPRDAVPRDLPTMRDPDRLVYFREEVGGMIVGGYERNPDAVVRRRHASRPTSTTGCSTRTGSASSRSPRPASRSCRRSSTPTSSNSSTARRRSRPTASSSSARARSPACSSPPGSAPTASPAPAASARSSPSGSSDGSRRWTCGRWTSAASGRSTQPRLLPRPHRRDLPHLLRHRLPEPRTPGRAAAAHATRVPAAPRARRGVRREERVGAGQLVRQQRGPRPRAAAAARVGGRALVDGDRHRAARHAAAAGAVRRVELRQVRGDRAGRGRTSSSSCAPTASTSASGRSPTRRCSTAAAGSSATSP